MPMPAVLADTALVIPLAVLVALAVDRLWGEPPVRWHPVVWMGRYLGWAGQRIAPTPAEAPGLPAWRPALLGALAWLAGAGLVGTLAWALGTGLAGAPVWLNGLQLGLLLKPLLAWRMLADEVRAVEQALSAGLQAGRDRLAWQVTLFMGLQSSLAYCVFGWLPSILQERGITPLEALYDHFTEGDGSNLVYFPIFNYNAGSLDTEREMLGHKVVTLHPRGGPAEWHMLYFHGGGFVRPMFKVHWPLVAEMVKACGISVTVPLYPMVPEAPYTAQDALADAVYAGLAASHDPARIILNGDSAGGHMALALALRLAKSGGPMPGKLALFAPWLDLGLADPEIAVVEPHDLMLKIGTLRACGGLVAAGRAMDDPAVSPLYAAPELLAQLPPTRIWTGRHDIFIIDSRSFLARLRAAGVDAKLYEYEAAPHVFMAITPTREAKDVLGLLRDFLAG